MCCVMRRGLCVDVNSEAHIYLFPLTVSIQEKNEEASVAMNRRP